MTTNVNDTLESYVISGVGPYAFTWRIFNDTDLTVNAISTAVPGVPVLLTYLTHYTVTGANVQAGGSVTLTAGAASTYAGYTLDIRSNTPENQPTSIRNQARFLPEIHEDAFDYLSRQIQDLNRRVDASIHLPDNETLSGEVESATVRKGRFMVWDAVTGAITSALNIATTALTQGIFNAYYFLTDDHKRTAAEIAAGVTPINSAHTQFPIIDMDRHGAVGTDITAELIEAIKSARGNSASISDGLGGTVTAYSTCAIQLGPGVYTIAPDTINNTEYLGLIIRGAGSRRTNNAIRGATTLLISGTSSSTGFGLKFYGNGARGLVLEDMDICYATSAFQGNLLDLVSCPGVTLNRCYLGTYGNTAGTRLQTATSLIRITYGEFLHCTDCVFDGSIDMIWIDSVRTINSETFGGSNYTFDDCVFYDCTGDMVRHDGERTVSGLKLNNCVFNPISVNCVRSVDVNNVEGLGITGCHFVPSTTFKASTEWLRVVNGTGKITSNLFDDLAKAGTVDGYLDISNNRLASTDGFTLMGGVITGSGNEISDGSDGFEITTPSYQLTVRLGPDIFKNTADASYILGASQATAKGVVFYDADQDTSTGKFTNSNPRIGVISNDEETTSQSADFTTTRMMSGRTQELTKAGSTQAVTLHAPTGGREIQRFFKTTSQTVTITCAGGDNFYTGEAAATSIATGANTAVGAYLELESYSDVGWKVTKRSTGWTFS